MWSISSRKWLNMPENLEPTIEDRETYIDKTPKAKAEEHVIDIIVHNDRKGEKWAYLINWYGWDSSDDSCEPLSRFPGKKVVSYHKRQILTFADNIDQAING